MKKLITIATMTGFLLPSIAMADSYMYRKHMSGVKAEIKDPKEKYICNGEIPSYSVNNFSTKDSQAIELTEPLSLSEYIDIQKRLGVANVNAYNMDSGLTSTYKNFILKFSEKQYINKPNYVDTYLVALNNMYFYSYNKEGADYYFEEYGDTVERSWNYDEMYGFKYISYNRKTNANFCIDPNSELFNKISSGS